MIYLARKILLAFTVVALFQNQLIAETEIRLGVMAPLSGDFASYGTYIKNGVDFALKDYPNANIKVFYEDACLPKQAVTSYKKLQSANKVQAIVGSYCVIGLHAFAPATKKDKVIVIHSSPIPQKVLDSSEYIFSTNIRTADEARAMANYAVDALKAKTAMLMVFDSPWGRGFEKPFVEKFEKRGGKVLGVETPPIDAPDFKSVLTKYKRNEPDVIYIVDIAYRVGTIMKQGRLLGFKSTYITVDEAEEEDVLKVAGETANGTILLAPEPDELNEKQKMFNAMFEKEFGYSPKSLTTSAYDATKITVDALLACKGDRVCAKDMLNKVENFDGISGTITIEADGGTKKNLVKKIVRDKQFVRF